ncbi:MAG: tRNA (adenosine(37)-N6)-threonylcarbamoyltransferase complex dimerization subunit type 1 TsaB [Faecalibacterium sp.]|nr:tRNA (adenosine(37)-N6)-threonylcarbamoyltransferase complex dimerization subunit type 1 TsaB [Ruminococcus sp.]MCM1392873.1 tRNA (adenosine(37)-N6)-threonylcarbamoyltransferase complex dimerization subunit type 1 TsaB [Ruminococcus sp.]MCM1485837.1 tRNA (adenosine(37)-N6)-threonylcarbamoyltransferase complex dimerization subunit type 1 TsaB [Faecalibacterium sp.]
MKILAVDTSAVCASVAITENGKIISQCSTNAGLTHSRTLLPMIDSALKNSETKLDSIDYFACANGPGSFTGIRIGISAIKGLAYGMNKKCIAVSTLEGLAYNLLGQDVIACAVMDARCSQVYTSLFDISESGITRLTDDEAIKIEELGEKLKAYDKKIIFVGDGAEICHRALGYSIAASVIRYQNAASVAFAAENNFDESKLLTPSEIMPAYLRLPQAERELKAKQKIV